MMDAVTFSFLARASEVDTRAKQAVVRRFEALPGGNKLCSARVGSMEHFGHLFALIFPN